MPTVQCSMVQCEVNTSRDNQYRGHQQVASSHYSRIQEEDRTITSHTYDYINLLCINVTIVQYSFVLWLVFSWCKEGLSSSPETGECHSALLPGDTTMAGQLVCTSWRGGDWSAGVIALYQELAEDGGWRSCCSEKCSNVCVKCFTSLDGCKLSLPVCVPT